MNLRLCLIVMTALAVITDNMLIPFYPQYFANRFGNPKPEQVGAYLAAICVIVMFAFPLWARLAKRIHPIRILIWTQLAAGLLCVACYTIDSLPVFWVVSLIMVVFKGSYLLMYPYVMSLEHKESHTQTIGTLSVVVHFGAILGAAVGGLVLQALEIGEVFLIMALGDFVQMAICMHLMRSRPPASGEAGSDESAAGTETVTASPARTANNLIIFKLCLLMLLFYFSAYVIRPFFSVFWQQVSALESELITGFVYSLPGAVALVALWWSKRAGKQGSGRQSIMAALLLGACGIFMQAFSHEALILLGRVLFGWSLYQVTVRLDALMFEMSSPEAYAIDFSKINFFQSLGVMCSSYGAGLLVSHYDLTAPFWVGAAGLLVTAILFPWLVRMPARVATSVP
ncbi:putative MFS family arabinose efflux permease [Pseudomonas duriflava]|uniref:Putative MFS family arabinose efflux permease n=1 Tax=Pseudomonas duriflava TaxID=459528 RepID=A0A562Q7H2_9PSED|nr:MFS transporter [Pseudomonas duriflava]TWI52715.1 putative MFS family arabinose efflux permease [Pseudomonas duriflava]